MKSQGTFQYPKAQHLSKQIKTCHVWTEKFQMMEMGHEV